VEEGERDRGERSGSTGDKTGEGEQVGESEGTGEENGEDTGSYLEGKGNLSSNIGEEIGERGEGEGKIRGKFSGDSVTWSNNLLITNKTSFRVRLFRRFRIRLNCARELRQRGTRGSTKIRTNYDRSNCFLWRQNLASYNDNN